MHVRLLGKIGDFKRAGRSLAEIRTLLRDDLAQASEQTVDLAGQEHDRIHRAILRVATEEFAAHGYERTHVADIISAVGVTSQVFYSHFPSKLQLLVESFHTFLGWNLAYVEPRLADAPDLGERVLWRLFAHYRADAFGSEVLSQLRMERTPTATEKRALAEQAWDGLIPLVQGEFEAIRAGGSAPPAIPLELLATSMIGAHFSASARATWDETVTRADVMRTHLWLWLAVEAALSGEVDIDGRLARYEPLLQELAAREPETPPAIEE